MSHYDVIVIGSGAGGGTLVRHLAPSGKRVLRTPSNEEPKKRLLHQLKSMLGQLGMHHVHLVPRHAYLKNDIPVAGCAHQAGTCRFGADPASSVMNTDCRAHEVDNAARPERTVVQHVA